jgi:hydroxymethylglutaryl-CoA reductase
MSDSRISGFYRMGLAERIDALVASGLIGSEDAQRLHAGEPLLNFHTADKMIENVVGVFGMPLAVATNIRVNGKDYAVPMVVEEPSIVAGVSGAAKLMRGGDGIEARAGESLLIGQVQLSAGVDIDAAILALSEAKEELFDLAKQLQPRLVERGGGMRSIEFYRHELADGGEILVVHLLVDTCDAMGANIVNTLCESLAPEIAKISGAKIGLRILSNLADRSLVSAKTTVPVAELALASFSGGQVRDGIVAAAAFAHADPYRAATHNKGIMNGIDAVAIATGNDWRSVEAAAHAYAAQSGFYRALTNWSANENGDLQGELLLPLKIGTVGGSLLSNPGAAMGLRIAGADSARELAELMAAVGLAQNFAALRALGSRGIQDGHMRLHARSVAASVGAPASQFDVVVDGLVRSGQIKDWKAREILDELHNKTSAEQEEGATVNAAAKVILLGEHAAVYGKHVLALPLPEAMCATATETSTGVRLIVNEWNFDETFESTADAADGAAAIVASIVNELNLQDRGCEVSVSSRVPAAAGLGSSAALATVMTRAMGECFDLRLDDEAVNRIALACERKIHGDPSGVDNTIAVYARPILFRKGEPDDMTSLELGRPPPLVIGISGSRGNTRDQVRRVRARFEKNRNLYARVFDQIDRLSVAGADALRQSDYESLGEMMNVCQGLLNGIQVSTPELERMLDMARRNGAIGAKLTGAGGGGAVIALCPDRQDQVASAWRMAGYDVLQLNESSK